MYVNGPGTKIAPGEAGNDKGAFMRKTFASLVAGVVLMVSGMVPAHAAIVNLDTTLNSGQTFGLGPTVFKAGLVTLTLDPGTYTVTPVDTNTPGALFTAALRFSGVSGCVGDADCSQGWEHSYYVQIGADSPVKFGEGGGIGPLGGGAYYSTAAGAFAAGVPTGFTLLSTTDVQFFWFDDIFTDNSGGISLDVAVVPLPAPILLLGGALAALGLMRRRAG